MLLATILATLLATLTLAHPAAFGYVSDYQVLEFDNDQCNGAYIRLSSGNVLTQLLPQTKHFRIRAEYGGYFTGTPYQCGQALLAGHTETYMSKKQAEAQGRTDARTNDVGVAGGDTCFTRVNANWHGTLQCLILQGI
ncbi:hypothetical protein EJ05DRAFT_471487 [Pseudovirgaria hyperparasitica]|uniref:Ecp2 effector protein domain-containing protein n=1 Tax=Pseudovirgaria hyperparasitica TaxID=470096 RepID=A0A6A6WI45_9PEZI|nr:uncharacterized protein EJ05DRAFT_471487 [Pseudovirgaria hyperparasitica]KAF2762472.1 hypothetical protein EJ05DRAFT_471487 [Pseudovirgaria hyperparasitica]